MSGASSSQTTLHPDVERVAQLDDAALRMYVRERLLGLPSEPSINWTRGEEPVWFLLYAYQAADAALRDRLRVVGRDLLATWRPTGDSPAYAGLLIYLVGQFGVERGEDILEALEHDPAVQNLEVDGRPLRLLVLRALAEFPGQQTHPRWRRLLSDPQFFDTAFLAFHLQGAEQALGRLPDYVAMAELHHLDNATFELRISNLIVRHFWPARIGEFWSVVDKLPEKQQDMIEIALRTGFPKALEARPPVPQPVWALRPQIPRKECQGWRSFLQRVEKAA